VTYIPHGKYSSYTNHKCRCARCRDANTAYHLDARARRATIVPNRVHGSRNGYVNYNCRCTPCTQSAAEYNNSRKKDA